MNRQILSKHPLFWSPSLSLSPSSSPIRAASSGIRKEGCPRGVIQTPLIPTARTGRLRDPGGEDLARVLRSSASPTPEDAG